MWFLKLEKLGNAHPTYQTVKPPMLSSVNSRVVHGMILKMLQQELRAQSIGVQ